MAGVCEVKGSQFQEIVTDPTQLRQDSLFLQAMATCHSLIKLRGEITGNPLDVKLFDAIEWVSFIDCKCIRTDDTSVSLRSSKSSTAWVSTLTIV